MNVHKDVAKPNITIYDIVYVVHSHPPKNGKVNPYEFEDDLLSIYLGINYIPSPNVTVFGWLWLIPQQTEPHHLGELQLELTQQLGQHLQPGGPPGLLRKLSKFEKH